MLISPQKTPHDSCMTFTPSPEPRSTTTQQQRCCRLTFQRAQPLSGPGIKTAATKEKTFDLSVKFLPFEALMRESSHR